MEDNIKKLSGYRFSCGLEALEDAHLMYSNGRYKAALSRAYYGILHGIRSVNALDQFSSSQHADVISHFYQFYVRTGAFPSEASKMITLASENRERADALDFYVASRESAERQIERAEIFLDWVREYLQQKQII